MLRAAALILATVAALLARSTAAEATLATGTAGAVQWVVTAPFNQMPTTGFVPLTIAATNRGNKETTANYRFTAAEGFYGGSKTTAASGSLAIPPTKTATSTHWVWRSGTFGESYNDGFVSVSISTPDGSSEDTLNTGNLSGSRVAVAASLTASKPLASLPDDAHVSFDPQSLPADWRVFSSLHAVFIGAADWDAMSPGVRDALRTWVGLGGFVRVVSPVVEDGKRVANELMPDDGLLGAFANSAAVRVTRADELEGEVAAFNGSREIVLALGAPRSVLDRSRYRSRHYNAEDYPERSDNFPLRDRFGRRDIPYIAICVLLIAFAVLVGPVSLHLWAGPGRRHRLFFTTPIFSLATSGLLLVVMLFQDGLGISGRRFTILDLAPADSSQPNALVYQEQFSRAGMVRSSGFAVEDGLLPVISADDSEKESLTVRDGRAQGSWFSSRSDRSLVLAGTVPVRWKVTHEGASENSLQLRVESPLTDYEEAWFIDGDGLVWKWDRAPVADGKLVFIPAGRDPGGLLKPMFAPCSTKLREFVLQRAKQTSQRNRFWAQVKDGSSVARPTNPKIRWRESQLVLTSKVTPGN